LYQVLEVSQDRLALQDPEETQDPLDPLGRQGGQDLQDLKENEGQLDLLVKLDQ
jgi:hypothetical protein